MFHADVSDFRASAIHMKMMIVWGTNREYIASNLLKEFQKKLLLSGISWYNSVEVLRKHKTGLRKKNMCKTASAENVKSTEERGRPILRRSVPQNPKGYSNISFEMVIADIQMRKERADISGS
jgi:hypothetical protein